MVTIFLTNKNGHYFILEIDNINLGEIKGHSLHDSLSDMYHFVCNNHGLEYDEVEFNEIKLIQKGDDLWESHSTGCGVKIALEQSQTFESYISSYKL